MTLMPTERAPLISISFFRYAAELCNNCCPRLHTRQILKDAVAKWSENDIHEDQAKEFFEKVDVDGSGGICYDEFGDFVQFVMACLVGKMLEEACEKFGAY